MWLIVAENWRRRGSYAGKAQYLGHSARASSMPSSAIAWSSAGESFAHSAPSREWSVRACFTKVATMGTLMRQSYRCHSRASSVALRRSGAAGDIDGGRGRGGAAPAYEPCDEDAPDGDGYGGKHLPAGHSERVSIFSATSKSVSVRPPSLCVERTRRTLLYFTSISG